MNLYIEPSYLSRKQANEKTKLINEPHNATKREYLKTHTIAETLILVKK